MASAMSHRLREAAARYVHASRVSKVAWESVTEAEMALSKECHDYAARRWAAFVADMEIELGVDLVSRLSDTTDDLSLRHAVYQAMRDEG